LSKIYVATGNRHLCEKLNGIKRKKMQWK
jgi:hypothetical protein